MTDVDAYLASARARQRAVAARAQQRLARLGCETASGEPQALSERARARDGAMMRQLTKIWKRKGYRPCRGTSSITLPSGRTLVYDWKAERVVPS